MGWRIIPGDCVAVMGEMDEASVDAIVTDPPYGLEFLGKDWDRFRVDRWSDGRDDSQGSGRLRCLPKGALRRMDK
jgi:DNA modification methylase